VYQSTSDGMGVNRGMLEAAGEKGRTRGKRCGEESDIGYIYLDGRGID